MGEEVAREQSADAKQLLKEQKRSKEEKEEAFKRLMQQQTQAGLRFDKELRGDFLNVLNELYRRIPPEALKTVVLSVPTIKTRDPAVQAFSMYELITNIGSEFVIPWLNGMAQDLDRLARLLP